MEEGKALASQWDCPFYETSAANRDNVDNTFHSIVCAIRRREREDAAALARESGEGSSKKTGVRSWIKSKLHMPYKRDGKT